MKTRILSIVFIVALPTAFSAGCSKQISYTSDVQPSLLANCLQCHDGTGEGSTKSGFNVKSYESLMQGTKFGAVIEPGKSVSSTLYRLINHKADPKIQMPPHHEVALAEKKLEPLTTEEIETIKIWIDQGAKNN